jgi:hypothetical protein
MDHTYLPGIGAVNRYIRPSIAIEVSGCQSMQVRSRSCFHWRIGGLFESCKAILEQDGDVRRFVICYDKINISV